jgi:hypothetical protein
MITSPSSDVKSIIPSSPIARLTGISWTLALSSDWDDQLPLRPIVWPGQQQLHSEVDSVAISVPITAGLGDLSRSVLNTPLSLSRWVRALSCLLRLAALKPVEYIALYEVVQSDRYKLIYVLPRVHPDSVGHSDHG